MNHDVTAQRLTSAHPLSFLFWTGGGNAKMLQCYNAAIVMLKCLHE